MYTNLRTTTHEQAPGREKSSPHLRDDCWGTHKLPAQQQRLKAKDLTKSNEGQYSGPLNGTVTTA